MDIDVKIFANAIKEKTGLDLLVYSQAGKILFGEGGNRELNVDFEGVKSDAQSKSTIFSFTLKNKDYVGEIAGVSNAEKTFAKLIKELSANFFLKEVGLSKEDFYKAVLLGEINHAQILKHMSKFAIKDRSAFSMLVHVNDVHSTEVYQILKSCAEDGDFAVQIDDEQLVYVKFVQEEGGEYQSPIDYAEFIKQSVYEEMGIVVKIAIGSTVKSLIDLSVSYGQALTAFRMYNVLGSKGDIHSYKEYVLIKMLEDLPKYKLNEHLETLMDSGAKEIFNDQEMITTAEEFLENSLNTSETSRKLYLHRNTLIYRLDKIEKATGLDIRKFADALTFRLITIIARLIKQ